MFYDFPPFDPRHGLGVAQAIRSMRSANNVTGLMSGLTDQGIAATAVTFALAGNIFPAWYYAVWNDLGFLMIDGTSNQPQTQLQAASILFQESDADPGTQQVVTNFFGTASLNPNRGRVTNWAPKILASWIVQTIRNQAPRVPNKLYIGGWSYGGTIATWTMDDFRKWGVLRENIYNTTFGCPRVSGPQDCLPMSRFLNNTRWFNANDPIPLVPPRLEEVGNIALIFGAESVVRAEQFVHPVEGLQLDPPQTIQGRMLPSGPVQSLPASFASWLLSWSTNQYNDHSISKYVANLASYSNNLPGAGVRPGLGEEHAGNVPRRQILQALNAQVVAIFRQGAEQQVPREVIPDPLQFVAKREGRVWSVFWQGTKVCIAPTKRRARKLARDGNGFLRDLLRQASVDPTNLSDLFEKYLIDAADPGSLVKPTMKTQVPSS